MTTIGENLRRVREEKAIPQKGLARASGVSVYTISRIESGTTEHPQRDTLKALAKPLGVDVEELLAGADGGSRRSHRRSIIPQELKLGKWSISLADGGEELIVRGNVARIAVRE